MANVVATAAAARRLKPTQKQWRIENIVKMHGINIWAPI